MLNKLRIALVLLIIGAASGLSIVAVNQATEDVIRENRLREEHELYFEIFDLEKPDSLDVDEEPRDVYCRREAKGYDADRQKIGEVHFFCVEDEAVHERAEVYDGDGNQIGQVFRVDDVNEHGEISTLVAVDMNGEIIEVAIARTENTPNYVQRIKDNHLDDFIGQNIQDVEFYDGRTGATITYGSIRSAVNLTGENIAADRALADYRRIFPDADSYEVVYDYALGCIDSRRAIYDGDEELLGHIYPAEMDNEHGTIHLHVAIVEEIFYGVKAARPDRASEEKLEALEKYEAYEGESIHDIDLDYEETVYDETINHLIEQAIVRCQESDEQRELRQLFRWASSKGETVDIDEEPLIDYTPYYDEDDERLGNVYTGEIDTDPLSGDYEGGPLNLSVSIDTDGVVNNVIINSDEESGFASDMLEEEISMFRGIDAPIDEGEIDSVFSGATTAGHSVNDIVEAALDYHAEREDE